MNKLFTLALIYITLIGCSRKTQQAILEAEKIVHRGLQPIEEHDSAILILERCTRNNAINAKLAQYYYELGRLQEETYTTAMSTARNSFREGLKDMQRLGTDMDMNLLYNFYLADTRCLIRAGGNYMLLADSVLHGLKDELQSKDTLFLQLQHLKIYFAYKIYPSIEHLKVLKDQLEKQDDNEAKDKAHQQNAFYLGLTYWMLASDKYMGKISIKEKVF
jgi:hypothetical protein